MTQYYSAALENRSSRRVMRRNQNTVAYRVQKGLGPVTNTVIVILLLSVLGLIYLTQISKTSSYGYQINDLENKQTELQDQKRDLEVESARLQALEKVKQSPVAAAMPAPASTDYVE
jgi:hypothetical protein